MWFEWLIIIMYLACFIGSGVFCITWFPLALRARARGVEHVSTAGIVDYAGIQVGIFLATGIIVRNVFTYGVMPPRDVVSGIGRVMIVGILLVTVGVRLVRWGRDLWRARHADVQPDPFRDVPKSSSSKPS